MNKSDELYLSIKLYPSENHTGYNAVIKILKDHGEDTEEFGVFYLTFDESFPTFVWDTCHLSATTKEYLELLAQMHVEKTIAAQSEKSEKVALPANTQPEPQPEDVQEESKPK